MRVRSKLAEVEFRFGHVERNGNELVIYSHPDQALKSRVFVSPDDVLSAAFMLLRSPAAWGYALAFPFFYLKARREIKTNKKQS
jgi:hypothetical protein